MRVRGWQVQLLGILILLFLFSFIIPSFSHRIPNALQKNLIQQYQQQGYDWVKVTVKGREVTLSGHAPHPNDAMSVDQIAQRYVPIIKIINDMSPRIIEPYNMSFHWDGHFLSLEGYIADQQKKQGLLDATYHLLDKKQVTSDLKLGAGTPQHWQQVLKKSLEVLLKLQRGRVEIVNQSIYIAGQTPYSEQRDDIEKQFEQFPQYRSTFHIIAADASEKLCQVQFKDLLSHSNIRFAKNSAILSKTGYPLLTKLANTIALCPNATINIVGYTDNVGNDKDNMMLSLLRAKAVIHWLSQQGISQHQLVAAGQGRNNPIADNKTKIGRATNRRIEFIVEK